MTTPPPPWRIHIATTSRADFGIYRSVLQRMVEDDALDPGLIVTGMHLSTAFGNTVTEIEESGFPIRHRFEGLVEGETPQAVARSMAKTVQGMSEVLANDLGDLLLVLGDRSEMHALCSAAVPFGLPIAHIAGGDETEGAIDNVFRHSITKMAHLHFCTTQNARQRVLRMGEPESRVFHAGTPALDSLEAFQPLSKTELAGRFNPILAGDFILVTYHPVSLDPNATLAEFDALEEALRQFGRPAVFTAANADAQGLLLNQKIQAACTASPQLFALVPHFGKEGYFSAMHHADIMVGNSSSGIYEAASFGLPVVNIGERQAGREQSPNTLNATGSKDALLGALNTAVSPTHLETTAKLQNIYVRRGGAAPIIVDAIKNFLAAGGTAVKRFELSDD